MPAPETSWPTTNDPAVFTRPVTSSDAALNTTLPEPSASADSTIAPGRTATIVVPVGIPAPEIPSPVKNTPLVTVTPLTVLPPSMRSPLPYAGPARSPVPSPPVLCPASDNENPPPLAPDTLTICSVLTSLALNAASETYSNLH